MKVVLRRTAAAGVRRRRGRRATVKVQRQPVGVGQLVKAFQVFADTGAAKVSNDAGIGGLDHGEVRRRAVGQLEVKKFERNFVTGIKNCGIKLSRFLKSIGIGQFQ